MADVPSGGDGGAEETAYGLACLDYFLSNPDGTVVHPDLILFNFGLHDGPSAPTLSLHHTARALMLSVA